MTKNCPWCGHPLKDDPTFCADCKWTREKPNMRPALLAFGFFIVLSALLGFAALKWVRSQTGEIKTEINQIRPMMAPHREILL